MCGHALYMCLVSSTILAMRFRLGSWIASGFSSGYSSLLSEAIGIFLLPTLYLRRQLLPLREEGESWDYIFREGSSFKVRNHIRHKTP